MHVNIQPVNYAVGTNPYSIAIADLNKDGNLDIVTANYISHSVSLLLGNSAGTFSPAPNSPYSVSAHPISVAIADLNKDGNLDIATANYGAPSVSVLLGNHTGTFSPALNSPYSVGSGPMSVAIADLNRDGNLDIVTANDGTHSVSVLQNVGWTFSTAPNSPYSVGTNPYSVAIADLNRDGNLDIVTANQGAHSVSVLLGNSVGTFSPAPNSPYSVGSDPRSVAIADLNKDGNLDIVTANQGAHSVSVLLGNSVGTFSPAPNSPYSVGSDPRSVAIADLNKDGNLDIVTANFGIHSVSVLLGNPTGTFSPAPNSPYSVGAHPISVAIADLNRDGNLDIVTANYGANSVSVLFGTIDGPFSQSIDKFIDQKLEQAMKNLVQWRWSDVQPYVISVAIVAISLFLLKSNFDTAVAKAIQVSKKTLLEEIQNLKPDSGLTIEKKLMNDEQKLLPTEMVQELPKALPYGDAVEIDHTSQKDNIIAGEIANQETSNQAMN